MTSFMKYKFTVINMQIVACTRYILSMIYASDRDFVIITNMRWQNPILYAAIFFLLNGCSDSIDPADREVTFEDRAGSLCLGMRTDNRFDVIPVLAKPQPLKPYVDPVFGSRIIRVSDAKFSEVVKPIYSTIQSWNADESLMILYHTGGDSAGHHLYDGRTYEHIQRLDISTGSIEEVFWHHTDPDSFFYVSALFSQYGSLMKYNVDTHSETELANFSEICGDGQIIRSGNNVMMQSMDDDYFGFRCDLPDSDIAFSYQVSTGKTSQIQIGGNTDYEPWYAPMPTPSGNIFLLNEWLLSNDLQQRKEKLDFFEFHSHSSLGRLSNGRDALFATGFDLSPKGCSFAENKGEGALIAHDLSNGNCRSVISQSSGYGLPISGTHISAVAYQQPGWVVLSSIGYERFSFLTNLQPTPVLLSEIYMADTKPDKAVVCRLAHHRSHAKDAVNGGYAGYFGEPHATVSPSGTRVLFGSDWHDSGSVDSYVIELPGYTDSVPRQHQ